MLQICGVSKMFGEWYQKTNKTEGTAAIQQRVTAVLPLLTVFRSFMNVANRVL
jgi:hypothetical protein